MEPDYETALEGSGRSVALTLDMLTTRVPATVAQTADQRTSAPNTVKSQSNRIQQFGRGVARLVFTPPDSPARTCTGFLITASVVMTNYHCIDGLSDVTNAYVEFDYYEETSEREDFNIVGSVVTDQDGITTERALDVALLRLDRDASRPTAALAVGRAAPGSPAVLIGHPGGAPQIVSLAACRIVASLPPLDPSRSSFEVSHACFTETGSSGAPLFDFETGAVVALHHEGFERAAVARVNRAVAMDAIVPWLKQLQNLPITTK